MKKINVLLVLIILGCFLPVQAINKAAAARRRAKIEAAKKRKETKKVSKTPVKVAPAYRRVRRNLGYIRNMPNKLIKSGPKATEGYLVNHAGQRFPIIISETKLKQGFYLGSFYDLDDWNRKHAYLK